MAYIGNPPITGNFQVCDAISVVNGQAAYTMQVSSANVSPESANHMLVSLNGVLQKPGSSFTISGSTITFASNLATGDVIDFIILLGNVLDLGVPSDATVTNAKTNFTSTSSAAGLQIKGDGTTDGTLQLNCSQNSHGIKLASPAHSAGQSYTLKFPTGNVTAEKFLRVASVSGSGTTGIGQLDFADAGGGAFEKLLTTTVSTTSAVTFNSTYLTTTYRDYRVIISGLRPASDNVDFAFTVSADNGSNYENSNYAYANSGGKSTNTAFQHRRSDSTSSILLNVGALGTGTGESYNAIIDLFDPLNQSSDNYYFMIGGTVHHQTEEPATASSVIAGVIKSNAAYAYNNVKFALASGNMDVGTFTLYGRKI